MGLVIETFESADRVGFVPRFARGALGETLWSVDLACEVTALAPLAAPETAERLGDAVSLRGANLLRALILHFGGDLDEALAALDDYAGAYDSLADFGRSVGEERCDTLHQLAQLPEAYLEAFAGSLIAGGEVFVIALGRDLHLFWRV